MRVLASLFGLALCTLPALAEDEIGRIRVIGTARQEQAPDFAEVSIGVQATGKTPSAALDTASGAARGIADTAKALGVPAADIATSSLTLEQKTKEVRLPDGSRREEPDGYIAGNHVTVRLGDMGKLGDLLRKALDSGANRIEGVSFGLRDPAAAQAAVQVGAMKDARAQAERLAEAAGVKLGPAIAIDSPPRGETSRPMPFASRAKVDSAPRASVPIEAGSIETSAEVDATFAIGK